jgi:hypothetical protein
MENLPNRASDGGPEEQQRDWRDWLYEAEDACKRARRAEWSYANAARLRHIQDAMEALHEAKELLCR